MNVSEEIKFGSRRTQSKPRSHYTGQSLRLFKGMIATLRKSYETNTVLGQIAGLLHTTASGHQWDINT